VNQVGYGPWNTPSYTGSVPGKGLTYEVSWMAPYVGGRGELAFGPVTTALDAWFSPIATGKDEDDHLLRSKRSTTDASGLAWQVRGEGRYALGYRDALSVHAGVIGFSAKGTQTQTFYAGPDQGQTGTIGAKLDSLRWSVGLAWTHRL